MGALLGALSDPASETPYAEPGPQLQKIELDGFGLELGNIWAEGRRAGITSVFLRRLGRLFEQFWRWEGRQTSTGWSL